jgi:hypothetical protein
MFLVPRQYRLTILSTTGFQMICPVADRAAKSAICYDTAMFIAGDLADKVGHGHFDM